MRMEVNHFSTNRLLLSSSPVTLSVLFTSCCCIFRSLVGQSPLLCEAQLFEAGLSVIRSLVGQSPLLCEAQLFEAGLPLIRSLVGQSYNCRSRSL